MYNMFVNMLFAIIILLSLFINVYAIGYHTSLKLKLKLSIKYDRVMFGFSVSLLFMVLQPGLYWLYASTEVYIKIVDHKLWIGAYQWYWKLIILAFGGLDLLRIVLLDFSLNIG